MPQLEGLTVDEARRGLPAETRLSFLRVIDGERVDKVVRTNPPAGRRVYSGQKVVLVVGEEPSEGVFEESRTLPEERGQEEPTGHPVLLYIVLQAALLLFFYHLWKSREENS
jgi:beta-lactam-binding protein with PASTA domain